MNFVLACVCRKQCRVRPLESTNEIPMTAPFVRNLMVFCMKVESDVIDQRISIYARAVRPLEIITGLNSV